MLSIQSRFNKLVSKILCHMKNFICLDKIEWTPRYLWCPFKKNKLQFYI